MTDHDVRAALAALAADLDRPSSAGPDEEALRLAFRRRHASGRRGVSRRWPLLLAAAGLAAAVVALIGRGAPPDDPTADADAEILFALRPGESAADLDGSQLVRVRLSATALRAMGVALSERAASEVEADVLIGYDGVARAVRVAGPAQIH